MNDTFQDIESVVSFVKAPLLLQRSLFIFRRIDDQVFSVYTGPGFTLQTFIILSVANRNAESVSRVEFLNHLLEQAR